MAAGDDDDRARLGRRIRGEACLDIVDDDGLGMREAFAVGELGPVVDDGDAVPEQLRGLGHGAADVSAAHHDHFRGRRDRLDEVRRAVAALFDHRHRSCAHARCDAHCIVVQRAEIAVDRPAVEHGKRAAGGRVAADDGDDGATGPSWACRGERLYQLRREHLRIDGRDEDAFVAAAREAVIDGDVFGQLELQQPRAAVTQCGAS